MFSFVTAAFCFLSLTAVAGTCGAVLRENLPALVPGARYVVILDGYSSGNLLAPALKKRGLIPIHLLSSRKIPAAILASYVEGDYEKGFHWHADDPDLDLLMRHYPIFRVLPGAETGVPLADEWNERLGLPGNGTALSIARRNKYWMQEKLRDNGVAAIQQFVSRNLAQILRDAPALGVPVVMKPLLSAGTDGFHETRTDREREIAFTNILGDGITPKDNAYGLENEEILVQEYLDGDEYFIDSVLLNGEMVITDAAVYEKTSANGSHAVYLGAKFVPYSKLVELGIPEYLEQVHKALGIIHGPSHAELKMVLRNGKLVPVLIEVGTRLPGGGVPLVVAKANGKSALEVWLDSLLDPDEFRQKVGKPYSFRPARFFCLIARKSGTLIDYPYEKAFRSLSSFFRFRKRVGANEHLPLTTNFLDIPGQIDLVHDSQEVVDQQAAWIRGWETNDPNFYRLEEEP